MRTTVRLNDQLIHEAKRYAHQQGKTLTRLIEEGLRFVLSHQKKTTRPKKVKLTTVNGKGLITPICLHDNSALLDWLEKKE